MICRDRRETRAVERAQQLTKRDRECETCKCKVKQLINELAM